MPTRVELTKQGEKDLLRIRSQLKVLKKFKLWKERIAAGVDGYRLEFGKSYSDHELKGEKKGIYSAHLVEPWVVEYKVHYQEETIEEEDGNGKEKKVQSEPKTLVVEIVSIQEIHKHEY